MRIASRDAQPSNDRDTLKQLDAGVRKVLLGSHLQALGAAVDVFSFFGFVFALQWTVYWAVGFVLALVAGLSIQAAGVHVQSLGRAQLDGVRDPRAIGRLVELLHLWDSGQRQQIHSALVRLLADPPRVRREYLTEAQWDRLYGVLRTADERNHDLVIALLRVFRVNRDVQALPSIEAMLRRIVGAGGKLDMTWLMESRTFESIESFRDRVQTMRDRYLRIQEAGEECAVVLREEAQRQEAGRLLLRPSDQPAEVESLLRVASGAGSNAEDVLLRSAAPDD